MYCSISISTLFELLYEISFKFVYNIELCVELYNTTNLVRKFCILVDFNISIRFYDPSVVKKKTILDRIVILITFTTTAK